MVWTVVSLHHKTNIVFINGNLTAARYQHEVLDTEFLSLLRNHRGIQLLHDGASSPSGKGHHCISECKQRKCRNHQT